MLITKRDGSKEDFDKNKIISAIQKAYTACYGDKYNVSEHGYNEVLRELYKVNFSKINSIEEVQNIVEDILMRYDHKVAKAFIIYRDKHKQARLVAQKLKYIQKYTDSNESATNLSNTDDNANSNQKSVASLDGELFKDTNRLIQRAQMKELLSEIQSPYKNNYIKDLEHHIIYQHDETGGLKPYCSAYTLYPLLIDGTNNIDGTKNKAPQHLSSFVGQFQNLVFLLSAQKKGAGAYGEFFNFFSYFCEKEWGEKYYEKADVIITNEHCLEQRTIGQIIDQYFQSITHYINQPAGNRGNQSPFTNFNVFDSYYWHTMFDEFVFPDGSHPHWDAVNWLQKRYMKWLNKERTKTLLTFPVMTVCCLTDGNDVKDKEYKDFITTQWAEGDSFFVYLSKNADSIASCCRLRNEVTSNTFSSTTGLTGVQTGSCNVMTLNLNRIVQDWYKEEYTSDNEDVFKWTEKKKLSLASYLKDILDRVYDYQKAYKTGLYHLDKQGMLPQTKAGYINLDKLYCTIGVNGLNEAARFFGMKVSNNKEYMDFITFLLSTVNDYNKEHSKRSSNTT